MIIRDYFPTATQDVAAIARGASGTPLTAPTPCREFDLRHLIDHLIGTTGGLTRLGRREPLDPNDPYGSRTDATSGDWPAVLAGNLAALADAWSTDRAWEGTVDVGGSELPAAMIGEMSMAEVLLHGWDLAAASGQRPAVPDDVARELLRHIDETAEWGRSMGAYGDRVELDDGAAAGPFEHALAAAGRDPAWTSQPATTTAVN
jgi:uncharacterized protein (TIGR03086 family)